MVILPPPFVKTKYEGYFWNLSDKKLYSLKIDGVLKPLKAQRGGYVIPRTGIVTRLAIIFQLRDAVSFIV